MPFKDDKGGRWIDETLYEEEGFVCTFRADKVIYEETTGQQSLVIFENALFGRMMALDGVTQLTMRDEFIYHEMMTHVPILAHGGAKRVLIIGGGDGGILREVTRHKTVEHVTMVEIDPSVTEFAKKHLAEVSNGAFDDPRLNLVFADGAKFVEETEDRYDVIIVDSTDPIGPGEVLFREEFYRACAGCMNEGGVVVTQNGVPFMQSEELAGTMEKFRRIFAMGTCYLATIPTYVGGPMAMGWGTDNASLLDVSVEELVNRYEAAGLSTQYYTPEVHKAAFALPGYVSKITGGR
ncbi:spermidine synthase [Parvibaculum indicum]|uniref:polyamine aminopropyltransferase n=1 Tax=Parvibaculum indicum TaxID=562969 RepID=UPI00141F4525|nr:polyamine aminopropyltransferase [Parvibaculum indicum]NIJ41850.1 spermidine synthase [Parvibaculum indicum]